MGMTPFMEAASEGHEIILQLFLQHVSNWGPVDCLTVFVFMVKIMANVIKNCQEGMHGYLGTCSG